MDYFKSKKVLVTGASSGIGVAFARYLSIWGAELIITSRRKDRLEQLAAELREEHDAEVTVIAADLSDPDGARLLSDQLDKKGISVDILINNAGFGYNGRFEDAPLETYEQMMQVNMNSLVTLTRTLLPGMLERNHGGVLNVASMAGFLPIPYFGVYSATKQFVINLSWSLWHELKHTGVRVSVLCPGPVNTEFMDVAGVDKAKSAFRGLQQADEVALRGLKGLAADQGMTLSRPLLRIPLLLSKWIPIKIGLMIGELAMKK
ncbi:SDR family oxidoreductase [Balneolales bacterium ANBcel1]|nr:SDR family oxidoreductase [Balneolales bacterium ANBcel1]